MSLLVETENEIQDTKNEPRYLMPQRKGRTLTIGNKL